MKKTTLLISTVTLALSLVLVTIFLVHEDNPNPSKSSLDTTIELYALRRPKLGYLGVLPQLKVGEPAPPFPSSEMKDVLWLNTPGSTMLQKADDAKDWAIRGNRLSMKLLQKQGKIVLLHFWFL